MSRLYFLLGVLLLAGCSQTCHNCGWADSDLDCLIRVESRSDAVNCFSVHPAWDPSISQSEIMEGYLNVASGSILDSPAEGLVKVFYAGSLATSIEGEMFVKRTGK